MAQQTAVEFLVSRINKVSYDKVAELIEQAKQMEKQQIRDAYNQGDTDVVIGKPGLRSGTMYYEQMYGK